MKKNGTTMEDQDPIPEGELTLRLIAGRHDTNVHGGISGGWVAAKMDEAAESIATGLAHGRVANVSMESMVFMSPIRVGDSVCIHTRLVNVSRSSIKIHVDVWARNPGDTERHKVVDASLTYVAIDEHGRIRALPQQKS